MHDLSLIKEVYSRLPERLSKVKKLLGRPLSYAEKILYTHLFDDNHIEPYPRGKSYVNFAPDRVAMQDATAQMALLQFINSDKSKTAVPSTVHCDHLIMARSNGETDLSASYKKNKEVYNFLESVSNKYGIGFWKPGSGIIHQVILENYAFPGGMMIGTDSHTPNAGGLGMIAIGVGGADAVDVMAGMPWELRMPQLTGVKLTGKLKGWTSPKDIILKLAGILTVKGGTGHIIEYFGEGAISLSATGKGTICNMGAEVGATTSIFAYDEAIEKYLNATGRTEVTKALSAIKNELTADKEVYDNPEKYFDRVIEIDLSTLEPHVNGPFTPDRAIPISKLAAETKKNDWPVKISAGLIGSCTNSSYEDISRAVSIAKQALSKGLKTVSEFNITPGSEQIRYTVERDGLIEILKNAGGNVFANACGPCIGQWLRPGAENEEKNTIIHSFNRNFAKRADGNPNTHAFVASPEIVTALTFVGRLDFNPLNDSLMNEYGEVFFFDPPIGEEFPPKGYEVKESGYITPAKDGSLIEVIIDANSERIQKLKPFEPWDGKNITGAKLLIKVAGKCTTDHISMAGPWLRYRGHLDHISNNMLIGAINAFNQSANKVKNQLTGVYSEVPVVQREYKAAGVPTIVVGDHNYGEGSSREHAAMEPRHLGVKVILVKSFARIHETNLKKQGMLALTFHNESDYDKIQEDDTFNFIDMVEFSVNKPITVEAIHSDGTTDKIIANHSCNEQQIQWFKAGSALNLISKQNK